MAHLRAAQEIDLPRLVLTEGGDSHIRIEQPLDLPAAIRFDQPPDESRAIIAVEVDTVPLRHGAAIDVAPGDRTAALLMAVFRHREGHARFGGITGIRMIAFELVPAKIHPARRTGRDVVNLLPRVLPHVADEQVAGQFIERHPPRVAQAIYPDLVPKWVVSRDRVWVAVINIQTQDLSK